MPMISMEKVDVTGGGRLLQGLVTFDVAWNTREFHGTTKIRSNRRVVTPNRGNCTECETHSTECARMCDIFQLKKNCYT